MQRQPISGHCRDYICCSACVEALVDFYDADIHPTPKKQLPDKAETCAVRAQQFSLAVESSMLLSSLVTVYEEGQIRML
jgi:hypothetical protein